MDSSAPKVLLFGSIHRSEEYSRSYTVPDAIEGNFLVGECLCGHISKADWPAPLKVVSSIASIPIRFLVLTLRYMYTPKHSIIFVPFPAHVDGLLAVLLSKIFRKKVVLDFLYGLYDTIVIDRCLVSVNSWPARLIKSYERFLIGNADVTLVDTIQHRDYLADLLHLDSEAISFVPVGIDENQWLPDKPNGKYGGLHDSEQEKRKCKLLLWSTFIPLHGVETVIGAAKLLENEAVEITIIGTGQTAPQIAALMAQLKPRNIIWHNDFVNIEIIRDSLKDAEACLGIFATGGKAARVVPYKAYQALAASKALITCRSPAIEDVLEDGISAMLVEPGDAQLLANAIMRLCKDDSLRESVAAKGHEAYRQHLSLGVIRKRINTILVNL